MGDGSTVVILVILTVTLVCILSFLVSTLVYIQGNFPSFYAVLNN